MSVKINTKVKKFKVSATSELEINSIDLIGKNVVLYFYPKDNTPGCTQEGEDFRDLYKEFKKLKTEIYGISRDSLKSHEGFKTKYKYPFELISDPDEKLCNLFDVIKEKNMYGKKYMGIERSTFLINKDGKLSAEWRKVKVNGHAIEVLEAVKKIS
ncbi:MAG: peroxiredoxin [Gammaproteobacteria bacterium]|jgi:peroxiredoxin Q/BCP|nr:MAG: peroxiredoxin [Gammaproteobacteria bacterium]|tara:strand:+ start:3195 stop:3662 length:468 start_codon:yes stop_codon:yes gene_type:complete